MPRKIISLGIADDMLCDQTLIEHHIKVIKNTRILFHAFNGKELLFKLNLHSPDIVIIDLHMPIMSGWETLYTLNESPFKGKILCTTSGPEPNLIPRLKELGVHGLARKTSNQIVKAIVEISNGRTYYEDFSKKVEFPIKQSHEEKTIDGREITIINKLAEGKTSKEISSEMTGLSANTIDTYINDLIHRFELKNRVQLIAYASSYGLIHTFENYKYLPKPKPKETFGSTKTIIDKQDLF